MADKKPEEAPKKEKPVRDDLAHERIDKLEALMRANGWTIPE